MGDDFSLVEMFLRKLGYFALEKPEPNANGVDLTAIGKRKSLRVEIKRLRILSNGSWQVGPVETNQRTCDAVAIILPNNEVIIESMDTYLSTCSEAGYKTYTWLKLD